MRRALFGLLMTIAALTFARRRAAATDKRMRAMG
jgi:hypothetical protein